MSDNALPNTAESAWKPYLPEAHPVIYTKLLETLRCYFNETELANEAPGSSSSIVGEIEKLVNQQIEMGTPIANLSNHFKFSMDIFHRVTDGCTRPTCITAFLTSLSEMLGKGCLDIQMNDDQSIPTRYLIVGDEMWTGGNNNHRGYLAIRESYDLEQRSRYQFMMTYLSSVEVDKLKESIRIG